MAKHPHADTLRCEKRIGEATFTNGLPGFTGQPCRCRLWMDLTQAPDQTTAQPANRVQGCFFDLFPWMISGPIVKANIAAAEAAAMRRDLDIFKADLGRAMGALMARAMPSLSGGDLVEILRLRAQQRPELVAGGPEEVPRG